MNNEIVEFEPIQWVPVYASDTKHHSDNDSERSKVTEFCRLMKSVPQYVPKDTHQSKNLQPATIDGLSYNERSSLIIIIYLPTV